jgi:RNA polymerase sigma-70 factor, ECF subfamily
VATDEELALQVRAGSRQALETLFERYRDAIWRFFARRLRETGRAEELLQDVFVAVLENARRYEPRAAFRSYLFGIAFNLLKAERRRTGHQPGPIAGDMAAAAADPDSTMWVRRALDALDADYREVVMLREYEGLTYQEIAELLHLPINTVRSRLFRARMGLKDALSRVTPLELKVNHEIR